MQLFLLKEILTVLIFVTLCRFDSLDVFAVVWMCNKLGGTNYLGFRNDFGIRFSDAKNVNLATPHIYQIGK